MGFKMGRRVLEEGEFSVYVYAPPREHRPPHAHVECTRGGEVMVKLGNDYHMRAEDAREALRIVEQNQERLIEEWRRLHGS